MTGKKQERERERERNVLFNDALNTFYLRLYGIRHMVKDHSDSEKGNPCRYIGYSYRLTARVLLYAPSHRQDNTFHGRHIGYSYRLTARVLLYAPSHRQDSTYHGLCYTSRGALAGMRNSWKETKTLASTVDTAGEGRERWGVAGTGWSCTPAVQWPRSLL